MAERRGVQNCRWAEPTLFLDNPSWIEAVSYEWSCRVDGDPVPVVDTDRCATCDRWVPRSGRARDGSACLEFVATV